MILSVSNINKHFDGNDILINCSFNVEDHEKVAVVGINGAGKSTLFKIIVNELEPDSGVVTLAKDKTLGYLSQYQNISSDNSVYDEVLKTKAHIIKMEEDIRDMEHRMKEETGDSLSALMDLYNKTVSEFERINGYAYKSEITGTLKGLGFSEESFDTPINSLSGGQKTRLYLAKLLLNKPDVILLDEPTNHLDIESIEWLENFLSNYDGAVVIVSHDRYFLDKIVNKVVEIERGKTTVFTGTYSDYSVKKKTLFDSMMKAYINNKREIKHEEEVIEKLKSFNREKSIKRAESRMKALDKIEVLDKPTEVNDKMKIKLEPFTESGNVVLTTENLSKGFSETKLFEDLNLEIRKGERVAVIGPNGTGKTTLLKIINGIIPADSGTLKLGANVNIGYYDQEQHVLSDEKTLFEEIQDTHPDMDNTSVRNVLAAFLFTNDDVFKRIGDLSGGEKGRVSLAKLMLSKANFLILDEPTNHLDVTSKEILENALNSYTGTVLFVSHDRYFINSVATRVIALHDNKFIDFVGNYDYYLEKKDLLFSLNKKEKISNNSPDYYEKKNDGAADYKEMKALLAKERKIKNEISKIEDEISKKEEKKDRIMEEMADPANARDSAKLVSLQKELDEVTAELEGLYAKWESYF